jgi:hypothetical protein
MTTISFYFDIIELCILCAAIISLVLLLTLLIRYINATVHTNIKLLLLGCGSIYAMYATLRSISLLLTLTGIAIINTNIYATILDRGRIIFSGMSAYDFVTVVIERTIATIYSSTYERMSSRAFIFGILISCQVRLFIPK